MAGFRPQNRTGDSTGCKLTALLLGIAGLTELDRSQQNKLGIYLITDRQKSKE